MSINKKLSAGKPNLPIYLSWTAQPCLLVTQIKLIRFIGGGEFAFSVLKIGQLNSHCNSPQRRTAKSGAMRAKGHYSDAKRSVNAPDPTRMSK